uniref:Outer membrane lipoprotein-sorting protein n=1 Tax=Candidatus Kentrum sp. UNK TaxID=2126344 RepID=A0A451AW58_9GAMM|nr:MAG: hypothetical protein BECKUNK1418G_GA0071005_102216 [Candidatus Kentron sp. UNK]VFK70291.1 MAG: hypothetical protein BECKUNK1418H_GA0071006_102614 [Candidatus Kentron sp. UNK]
MHKGLQFFLRIISVTVAWIFCLSVQVVWASEIIEFSADIMQKSPDRDTISGKLYRAKDKIRMEEAVGEHRIITIEDISARKILRLDPARKGYVEALWLPMQSGQARSSTKRPLPGDPDHPCAKFPQLKCKMLNKEEMIDDRKTEKWEIVRVMQASEQGARTRTMRSLIWVDRRLGVNVREERFLDNAPKGTSELRNIIEGAQSEDLFKIPEGYQRMEMPKPSAESGRGGGMQPVK